MSKIIDIQSKDNMLFEPLNSYCKETYGLLNLFAAPSVTKNSDDIMVVELFAGVGGFRIGLERASSRYKTIWNNQWEPSTKKQDASLIYCKRFGVEGHSNQDISTISINDIPEADLLVGGFPCQDYSVATTLKNSGGIEGKKGVLWWQIYRILKEYKHKPKYLFLENVDRLLKSPSSQRGRDFAIILSTLSDLGYSVEWRIINAADYGMPQRRRRTYIVAYHSDSHIIKKNVDCGDWVLKEGVLAKAFPIKNATEIKPRLFTIKGDVTDVYSNFNVGAGSIKTGLFYNSGLMINRNVYTIETIPEYNGAHISLGDILVDESIVPDEYFISPSELEKWKYLKGSKSESRVNRSLGFEYKYSEGSMAFPDYLDRPSRTIITGEGGSGPSRFKHVIKTPNGRYRRLLPIELERLNMFPDNHTQEASDMRRAFLMGNALVTEIITRIGIVLLNKHDSRK
ncbi:MAG: DNA (cytosine-5-)-methyltransferase [Bacteroidales bacterium]|nr:DNA (cytosine-5-)-methyltransferase [Bacteroidales bacterium]MDD4669456.1 DNA (cytosine-5-)-methyltransferase [Bacteroidales bacterium]